MNKLNRRALMALAGLSMVTLISATGVTQAANLDDGLSVVFINDGHVAPYHVAWLKGFDDAIAAYNQTLGGVSGHWLSAEGSLEKMIQQVETTINEKPDVMFVNAINTEAFEPLVKKAQEAGIIWVAVHSAMESADYSFTLGDDENGYNQGLALGAYYGGTGTVGIMLGQAGNPSGEARRQGILRGLATYPGMKVVSEQPADWDTIKAQAIAENWYTQYPDLNAISVVTDGYLYPAMAIAENNGVENITFWGYDGEVPMLYDMSADGKVKADILLSGTREGWNFIQMAWKITHDQPVDKLYDFFTPLVLSDATKAKVLANGFPADIEVYSVEQALAVAENGFKEFGPDSVQP